MLRPSMRAVGLLMHWIWGLLREQWEGRSYDKIAKVMARLPGVTTRLAVVVTRIPAYD